MYNRTRDRNTLYVVHHLKLHRSTGAPDRYRAAFGAASTMLSAFKLCRVATEVNNVKGVIHRIWCAGRRPHDLVVNLVVNKYINNK